MSSAVFFDNEESKLAWAYSISNERDLGVAWNADHSWFSRRAALDGADEVLNLARTRGWQLDDAAITTAAIETGDIEIFAWLFYREKDYKKVMKILWKSLKVMYPGSDSLEFPGRPLEWEGKDILSVTELKDSWKQNPSWWSAYVTIMHNMEVLELARAHGWKLDTDVIFTWAWQLNMVDVVLWLNTTSTVGGFVHKYEPRLLQGSKAVKGSEAQEYYLACGLMRDSLEAVAQDLSGDGVQPYKRLNYTNLLKKIAPELAVAYGRASVVLHGAWDIKGDPTWLSKITERVSEMKSSASAGSKAPAATLTTKLFLRIGSGPLTQIRTFADAVKLHGMRNHRVFFRAKPQEYLSWDPSMGANPSP